MQPGMQLNGSVLRSADLAGNWPGLLEQGPAYVNPLFGVSAWQTPLGRSRLPTEQRGGIVRRSSGPGAPSLRSGPPGAPEHPDTRLWSFPASLVAGVFHAS